MSKRLNILLAEDDPFLVRYIQTLMSRWDCELAIESSAEGAIQRAATFSPDICLLGFVTPGMDGANAAIELLKVSPGTQIVLWNEPVPPEVLNDLRAQGYDFRTLVAPFNIEELQSLCFPSSHRNVE
ncbi:MAG TPA: response regulator [Alloacidobacterium sp.]|nr:response regulator [Alloacidobacterium sp.]